MKKMILTASLVLAFGASAVAQEPQRGIDQMPGKKHGSHDHKKEEGKSHQHEEGVKNADNKPVDLKAGERITRGAALTGAKKVSLAKALKSPEKYAGQTVTVAGVVTRACKMEGCWLELAPKEGAAGIRIKMKDHAFFVPLNSAGLAAKAEGTMTVKTLPKAEVDHLIEDGAKFDKRNADGSVTEVSFVASGVELTKK